MRRFGRLLIAAFAFALASAGAAAQAPYPAKPIKIIVPYAPGGLTDVVARYYAEQLRKELGQDVVVENKPGASGHHRDRGDGARAARRLHADDRQHLDQRADAGPARQEDDDRLRQGRADRRAARRHAGVLPRHHDDFPPKTFAEFIAYAKAHPGKVRYGSAGDRQPTSRSTPRSWRSAPGIELLHIPFKDGGPGILKRPRQRRHPGVVVQHHQSGRHDQGRQRAPAGGRGAAAAAAISRTCRPSRRSAFPACGRSQWVAAFAPAAMPPEIIETLHNAFVKATRTPELQEAFQQGRHGGAAARSLAVDDCAEATGCEGRDGGCLADAIVPRKRGLTFEPM